MTLLPLRLPALSLLAALTGCARPHLPPVAFAANPPPTQSAERFPRDPAVVLSEEHKLLFYAEPGERFYTEDQHREVLQVLSEAGFSHAEVRIPARRDSELVELLARTIEPDGQVHELDARAILTDEDRSPGDDDLVFWKTFRFPAVQVGSLLEYSYTLRSPHLYGSILLPIGRDVPVVHYHLEVRATHAVRYAFKVYNTSAPLLRQREGRLDRIDFTVDNVPGRRSEQFTPPLVAEAPFWVYRTQQVWNGPDIIDGDKDWTHSAKAWVRWLYQDSDKLFAKAELPQSSRGCQDKQCTLEQTLAMARDRAELIPWQDRYNPRPIKDVLDSGSASPHEKALLLYRLLDKAKLKPRFALFHRGAAGVVDRQFPASTQLNDLLIYVPEQAGLPATWIDPACEDCGAGQVRERLVGREVLVAWRHRCFRDGTDARTEFTTIAAAPRPTALTSRTYQVAIAPSGDATGTALEVDRAQAAVQRRLEARSFTPEQWQRDAEAWVAARSPSGRLEKAEPVQFDRAAGTARRTLAFSLPAYATVEGPRLLVPLSVLRDDADDEFTSTERTHPLHVERPTTTEEVAEIAIPPGFEVAELPAAEHHSSPMAEVDLSVTAEGGKVVARRTIRTRMGDYPVSAYPEIRQVMRACAAERQKVIVLRRGPASASLEPR